MKKALEVFNKDLTSLRTGRANVSMLDIIKVDVYGQSMSINQRITFPTFITFVFLLKISLNGLKLILNYLI